MFEPRNDGAWLVPANAAYRPIRLTDNSLVQGVLQVSLRLYGQQAGPSSTGRSVLVLARGAARSSDSRLTSRVEMPELEVAVARAYGIARDEFASLLGAFPKLTAAECAAHLGSELWS
jgi:hypothetical protein